jgi:hypothetical protein
LQEPKHLQRRFKMATNLQVQSNISGTAQYVQDASLNNSSLAISSGNIGIGTSNPVQPLTVSGVIRVLSSGNSRYRSDHYVGAGDSKGHINAYDDTGAVHIPLNIDAAPIVLNYTSGANVGIGVTSPAEKLDVNGSEIVRGDGTAGLRLTTSAGVNYIQSALISGGALTGAAELRFTNNNGANTWMRIIADGQVVIGAPTPYTPGLLHVVSDNAWVVAIAADVPWNGGIGIQGNAMQGGTGVWGNNSTSGFGVFGTSDQAGVAGGFKHYQAGGIAIAALNAADIVTFAVIGTGSVGIGLASPASALHIAAAAGGSNKGYITEEKINSTPSLSADGQMAIYSKGNKICIAKRVGATTRYTSIDMSANGNGWSLSGTTPP